MSQVRSFESSLKLGEKFEVEYAQVFLQGYFEDFYLIPTHNFQTKQGYSGGPRIIDGIKTIVMPDFMLVNKTDPNHKILVEAKWKKQSFSLKDKRTAFAIEEYKCIDYENASRMLGASLIYLIGNEETRLIHIYSPEQYVTYVFCNNYTFNKQVNNRCFIETRASVIGKF